MIIMKTKIDRLITDHAFVIAIVLSSLLFLFSTLLQPSYETCDDAAMEYLIYGIGYGHGTSFIVYINRILGYLILGVSKAVPFVNSYFLIHILTCFVSNVMLLSIFLKKDGMRGVIPTVLVLAADLECFYSIQFTKTAAIASVAGILGVLYYLKNRKKLAVVAGALLTIVGSMYRFPSFELVALLMMSIVIFEGMELFKNRKEQVIEYLLVGLLIVGSILMINMIGNRLDNSTPDLKRYSEFNSLRSEAFDYDRNVDEAYKKALKGETEVTGSQVLMFNGFMFNDKGVFDADKVAAIAQLGHVEGPTVSESIRIYLTFFLPNIFKSEPLMIVLAVTYLVSIMFSKNRERLIVLPFLYSAVMCFLIWNGRYFIHRVDWSIMFTVLVLIVYLFDPIEIILRKGMIKTVFMTCASVLSIAGCVIICFIPINDHFRNVGSQAVCYEATVSFLNGHEGYRYMIHPHAVARDDRRTIFSVPNNDILSDSFEMGDQECFIPESEVGDSCQIEGNPWTACVDSDDIRVVMPNNDSGEYCIKVMEYYIEEQYGLEVTHFLEDSNEYVLIYAIVSEDPVD